MAELHSLTNPPPISPTWRQDQASQHILSSFTGTRSLRSPFIVFRHHLLIRIVFGLGFFEAYDWLIVPSVVHIMNSNISLDLISYRLAVVQACTVSRRNAQPVQRITMSCAFQQAKLLLTFLIVSKLLSKLLIHYCIDFHSAWSEFFVFFTRALLKFERLLLITTKENGQDDKTVLTRQRIQQLLKIQSNRKLGGVCILAAKRTDLL